MGCLCTTICGDSNRGSAPNMGCFLWFPFNHRTKTEIHHVEETSVGLCRQIEMLFVSRALAWKSTPSFQEHGGVVLGAGVPVDAPSISFFFGVCVFGFPRAAQKGWLKGKSTRSAGKPRLLGGPSILTHSQFELKRAAVVFSHVWLF